MSFVQLVANAFVSIFVAAVVWYGFLCRLDGLKRKDLEELYRVLSELLERELLQIESVGFNKEEFTIRTSRNQIIRLLHPASGKEVLHIRYGHLGGTDRNILGYRIEASAECRYRGRGLFRSLSESRRLHEEVGECITAWEQAAGVSTSA